MTKGDILLAVVLGLVVNEACDISPWLARKVMRWAAIRRYIDAARAEMRAEELAALLDQRPGKLFKLITATGFAVSTAALVVRRSGSSTLELGGHHLAKLWAEFKAAIRSDLPGTLKVLSGSFSVLILAVLIAPVHSITQQLNLVNAIWQGPPPFADQDYAWSEPARVVWLAFLGVGCVIALLGAFSRGGAVAPRMQWVYAACAPSLVFAVLLTPAVLGLPWQQTHLVTLGVALATGSLLAFTRFPADLEPLPGRCSRHVMGVVHVISGFLTLAGGLATAGATLTTFAVAAILGGLVAKSGNSGRARVLGVLGSLVATMILAEALSLRIGMNPPAAGIMVALLGAAIIIASMRFSATLQLAARWSGHTGFVFAITLSVLAPFIAVGLVAAWIGLTAAMWRGRRRVSNA